MPSLHRSTARKLTMHETSEKPFWDVLQTPLQPLSHNLEYSTYETGESDPVKYREYQRAITNCLTDFNGNKSKKCFNDGLLMHGFL